MPEPNADRGARPRTDGGGTTVAIDDWAALREQFRRLDGDLTDDGDRLELHAGSARFAVTRDGTVDAGMPLHSLSTDGAASLTVHADRIEVRDDDGSLAYEFRLP